MPRGATGAVRELVLLEALTACDPAAEGLSVAALVAATGISRATCHRLIHALLHDGYAYALGRGRYAPGWRLHLLCRSASATSPLAAARPVLEELVASTGQTAHLGVLHGSEAVYIDCVDSPSSLRLAARPGSRIPVNVSAIGMAIAACLPAAEREALVCGTHWAPRTRLSLRTPEEVLAALGEVRRRGYAVDEGGYAADVRCLAAPAAGPDGRTFVAIGITGLASDLRVDDEAAITAVRLAAERLSGALGAKASRSHVVGGSRTGAAPARGATAVTGAETPEPAGATVGNGPVVGAPTGGAQRP